MIRWEEAVIIESVSTWRIQMIQEQNEEAKMPFWTFQGPPDSSHPSPETIC